MNGCINISEVYFNNWIHKFLIDFLDSFPRKGNFNRGHPITLYDISGGDLFYFYKEKKEIDIKNTRYNKERIHLTSKFDQKF